MNINQILALPVNKGCSERGADMGRRNQTQGKPERLHLQRLRFVDQCYDTGGAYWGAPENMYCAFSPRNTENDPPIRVFTRANNREHAKQEILELLSEGFTFFR